jgi:hypothetical protein
MNVEFHYYSTAFLAVKAGFSLDDATVIAYAGQYVDHHQRAYEIVTPRGTVVSGPTQNFAFWDPATVSEVLAPFHFLPGGRLDDGTLAPSVRTDGARSAWDVRPHSGPAKALLVAALKTRNLHRIGLALHTYSDTWAHQNFTARDEAWNRLDPASRLPSPGHAQAGFVPDLWLGTWTDPRLAEPRVDNFPRFAACARKVYRYLCTYRGKDFHTDEDEVAAQLAALVVAGRGRESVEDRVIEFVLELNLEPYDKNRWLAQALEPPEDGSSPWPILDRWKALGEQILDKAGLSRPQRVRAKPGFDGTPLAAWIRAAEDHRTLAKGLVAQAIGGER